MSSLQFSEVRLWPTDHKTFKANGDVKINGDAMTLKFSVINTERGAFLSLPQKEYQDRDGNRKYQKQVFMNRDLLSTLTSMVFSKYQEETGTRLQQMQDSQDSAESPDDEIPF